MKALSLLLAILASILLIVILVEAGISRPKAIIGMGGFAGAFWYYYLTFQSKPSPEKPPRDLTPRDWMGNPVEKDPHDPKA